MDPQEPFWAQPPTRAGRLVFADWLAEHGLPVMEAVQRWLAATGRAPLRLADGYLWELGSGAPHRLPHALFSRLRTGRYASRREAEEALASAWQSARRFARDPDYTPAIGPWP